MRSSKIRTDFRSKFARYAMQETRSFYLKILALILAFILFYVHTKVNLFRFITKYDKILRFMRVALTLDILKFIRIEVKY